MGTNAKEAASELQDPYRFNSQQHALERGFCTIRVAGFDYGPKRTLCSIIEVSAPPRLRKQEQAKAQRMVDALAKKLAKAKSDNLDKADSDELLSSVITDEYEGRPAPVLGELEESGDLIWKTDTNLMAECARIIAIYQINCTSGTLNYWVHPLIKESEIEPAKAVRAKWKAAAQQDIKTVAHSTLKQMLDSTKKKEATAPEEGEEEEPKFYLSRSAFADAFPQLGDHVNAGGNSYEAEEASYSHLIHNLTAALSHVAFAPLFHREQCIIVEEPQVDQIYAKQNGYVKKQERDPKLIAALFDAVQKTASIDISYELIRIYEKHVGMHAKPPINWGLSLCTMAAVRALDVLHGYTTRRLIMFHGRKFRIASVLAAQNPEYYNDKTLADTKKYAMRKNAPVQVMLYLIDKQIKDDPALVDLREFVLNHLDKSDDAADALCIPLDWAYEFLRTRPYNRLDREQLATAAALWKSSMDIDVSGFQYYTGVMADELANVEAGDADTQRIANLRKRFTKPAATRSAGTAPPLKKPRAKQGTLDSALVPVAVADSSEQQVPKKKKPTKKELLKPIYDITIPKPAPVKKPRAPSKKRKSAVGDFDLDTLMSPTQMDGVPLLGDDDNDYDEARSVYNSSGQQKRRKVSVASDTQQPGEDEYARATPAHKKQQEISFMLRGEIADNRHVGGRGKSGGGGDDDDANNAYVPANPFGSMTDGWI